MEVCCLCSSDVSSRVTTKAKRVKLFGDSAQETREKIELFLNEEYSVSIQETNLTDGTWLCHKCRNEIDRYFQVIQEINFKREKLLTKFKKVVTLAETDGQQCRKRKESSDPQSSTSSHHCTQTTLTTPKRPKQHRTSVRVSFEHPSGMKSFQSLSPWSAANINRICRGSYPSLAMSVAQSCRTGDSVLLAVAKSIRKEIKHLYSQTHNSILRDDHEGIKRFSWDTVWAELIAQTPTLVKLLSLMVKTPVKDKPLLCLMASMILKHYCPKVSLVQRAVSVLLYGCATPKKVFGYFQSLMLCHSHKQTIRIVNGLAEDFDNEVLLWSDTFVGGLKTRKHLTTNSCCEIFSDWNEEQDEGHDNDNASREGEYDGMKGDDDNLEMGDDGEERGGDVEEKDENDDATSEGALQSSDKLTEQVDFEEEEEVLRGLMDTQPLELPNQTWKGYKIVGDNIDKNVRRSFQRVDRTTRSLHYFHSFAVLDRVDLSSASDEPAAKPILFCDLLPSTADIANLKETFVILVSRILVKVVPDMKDQAEEVVWHIPHKYQEEMSQKSKVVPLGVIMRNENKLDQMCLILDDLLKYCPTHAEEEKLMLPDGNEMSHRKVKVFEIGIGGDQLTCARIRGAQGLRRNHDCTDHQLKSFVPFVEDWHSRLTLMTVIWQRMFSNTTLTEKGTLYQMKALLNLTSVPNDPKMNMKACEDFLLLVLNALVKVAAEVTLIEQPNITSVKQLAEIVIQKFVNIDKLSNDDDDLYFYTTELLTLALVWHNYHDSVKEGDGDRVMMLWKFLLVIFKKAKRKNYSKEAFILLMHYNFLLSDRLAEQLKWSRFVNTHGRKGCNIPCDLHLEHLNRQLKGVLRNLRSNLDTGSIHRSGKSIGVVHSVALEFEKQLSTTPDSGHHHRPAFGKDLDKLVTVIRETNSFKHMPNRKFASFKNKKPLLNTIDKNGKIVDWMVEKAAPLIF